MIFSEVRLVVGAIHLSGCIEGVLSMMIRIIATMLCYLKRTCCKQTVIGNGRGVDNGNS